MIASSLGSTSITHRSLSEDERKTPQIREIFELLVVQHPNYSNFVRLVEGDWATAQKVPSLLRSYSIVRDYQETYKDVVARIFHTIRRYVSDK